MLSHSKSLLSSLLSSELGMSHSKSLIILRITQRRMLPTRSVPLAVHLECGVISDVLENVMTPDILWVEGK